MADQNEKRILLVPDKFKGSLSSLDVCAAMKAGIHRIDDTLAVESFPMADGGDGFLEVLSHYKAMEKINCPSSDPLGRPISASYQWDKKNKTAVIEMAIASGLVLLTPAERNPLVTSTVGTGLLIKHAIDKGAEKIILGLGGSATNDGGAGILAALGFRFFTAAGAVIEPIAGGDLGSIHRIGRPDKLPAVQFEIACDVQNVLYGPQGAAFIYGPQKGADASAVQLLDKGLHHFAETIKKQTGKDVASVPGSGAAGGIAAGLMGFFEVELKKGIDIIITASNIQNSLSNASLLITGEGKLDEQSTAGKVAGAMAALARDAGIPCRAVCGMITVTKEELAEWGIEKAVALTNGEVTPAKAMEQAAKLITEKMAELI